ncbi:Crp/Fnr family transcriptional regulator [Pseudorhodobacter sp. E13]|uniref:Crp/Fnr family transcriptional regulator n=1 Tax=Pseudorhodobacter sp. E13 TaxID=2487931 RepID=UPI000F8C9AEA|nr:Crp/Fnr family transcriptional regulator [Pseudorhodobacter sp. E13]RUS60844.1 Crp/Fnr family transcriptional regulator [Pseudorhodobacter sp. E13]
MRDYSDLKHPCGNCGFRDQSVWQPVSGAALPMLTRGFDRLPLSSGQVLFEQGEENSGIYCVSKGLIGIRSRQGDGKSTLLRLAYPGEVIGFRSFMAGQPHQTEAQALVPSRVCMVPRHTVRQIMDRTPELLGRLADRCLQEIDRSHAHIIAAATRSNTERLSDLLERLMQIHGEQSAEGRRMTLPISRIDLADLLGIRPETLSRVVARLVSDGPYTISGREVLIKA